MYKRIIFLSLLIYSLNHIDLKFGTQIAIMMLEFTEKGFLKTQPLKGKIRGYKYTTVAPSIQ